MNVRLTLLVLLALLSRTSVFAQDNIYTTQGDTINALVTSESVIAVGFKMYEGGDSVSHRIRADYVISVRHADGSIYIPRSENEQKLLLHKLAQPRKVPSPQKSYPNVITFKFPFYFDIDHYPGIGIGLEYERYWGAKSHFSTSFSLDRTWAGTNAAGKLRTGEVRANIQSYYFKPGFFYHPLGNNKGFDIGIGASFPLGQTRWQWTYEYLSGTQYKAPSTDMLMAALAELNLSVYSSGHFVFTTSIAAGPLYSNGQTQGALVLFGIKWGSRF